MPATTCSAGIGNSPSGLRRGFGVFGTASRAPAGSSCGSTSSSWAPYVRRHVAGRVRGSFHPRTLSPNRPHNPPAFPYAGDRLDAVHGPLICVIEDEEVIASAVAARLRAEGFDVEVAHEGHAGVALCDRVRPDLVVLDLMLPGLDGLEVCRRVQRDRPGPPLVLTARAGGADPPVRPPGGAGGHITQPLSPRRPVPR